MNHLTEEQLIEHYYGEGATPFCAEEHLAECAGCRQAYTSLQQVLNVVETLPVPERGANYGEQVWQRLEAKLPARRRWWNDMFAWRWVAVAGAAAALLVCAFLAGRMYPVPSSKKPIVVATAADPRVREAVLLVAVGDYLERSQMVLIELANAPAGHSLDITAEQERAADLVTENRLYRQTASHTGDAGMVSVLDELERVLIEITHAPAKMSPEELTKWREKLRTEGILFKIRVLGSNVRNQLEPGLTESGQKL